MRNIYEYKAEKPTKMISLLVLLNKEYLKSQAFLDKSAVHICMIYTNLNLIKVNMDDVSDTWDHTNI